MADDLRVRLSADVSGFNQGMEQATDTVHKFQENADKATDSVKDFGKTSSVSTKELLNQIKGMTNAGKSVSNYRRQLSQMQRDIMDLTVNYRNMTAEMQNSDLGRATLQRINELTQKAGEYKDAMLDAQASVKALASDTANWDAAKQGIDAISSSLQGIVSAGVLGEKSTEDLVKVIAKLKGVEAATNAVIKVGNALQKQSALMMGISRIQTLALVKAKNLETIATGKATIAQKIFNTVAKANPYVLLATAILAVVGAIAGLVAITKKHNSETKKASDYEKDFKDKLQSTKEAAGETLAKFSLLQSQYRTLRSEGEKNKWIKENSDKFNELNLSINDVNDADDVFIKNASKVVRAMMLRAEAAAMMNMYQEEYVEAYKESLKIKEGRAQDYMSSSTVRNNWKKAGLQSGVDYVNNPITMQSTAGAFSQSVYSLTPEGKKKMDEYFNSLGEEAMLQFNEGAQDIINDISAKIAEAERLENEVGHFGKNDKNNPKGKPDKPEVKPDEGSLAAAQKIVSDLQTKLNNMSPENEEFEKTKEELQAAEKEVERIQALLKNPEVKEVEIIPENSLAEANHFVQEFQKQLQDLDPNTDEFKEVLELLNIWKKRAEEINNIISGKKEVEVEVKTKLDIYEDIRKQASDIQANFDIGAISESDARKQIEELNQKLAKENLTVRVSLEVDSHSLADTIDSIREKFDTISDAVASPIQAIDGIIGAFERMNKVFEDPDASAWDQFFAVFSVGESIISAVSTVMGVLTTVTDLLTVSKEKNAAASAAEAAATAANTTATVTDTGATITNAAAHGAAAAAEGGQSVASVPYIGPILAIAAIAAIMAAIIAMLASAKGFATGGVVGGNSYTGDKILARLNSGELILNKDQQESLWKQLNPPITDVHNTVNTGGEVTFKVHGQDLVGCLNNYNKKTSKI